MRRTMIQKLLLCLAILMLVTVSALAEESSDIVPYLVGGGYIYFEPSTGTVTGSDWNVTEVTIPREINGIPVTRIGRGAFANRGLLTSITIPYGVKEIDELAFEYDYYLESAALPSSIETIGWAAFHYCTSLKEISIPAHMTRIEITTFSECSSLCSIDIPETITSIGNGAFSDCKSLSSISIPSSVVSIEDGAFYGCESLTNVTLPPYMECIEGMTFYNCCNLEHVSIPTGIISIGDNAFGNCTSLQSIAIPNCVTSIGGYAFFNCGSLEQIFIPGSVESIGRDAFLCCSNLSDVILLSGVKRIDYYAFGSCDALNSITIPSSLTSIEQTALSSSITDIYYEGSEEEWLEIEVAEMNWEYDESSGIYEEWYEYRSMEDHQISPITQLSYSIDDEFQEHPIVHYNEDVALHFNTAIEPPAEYLAALAEQGAFYTALVEAEQAADKPSETVLPFEDVDPYAYYAEAVAWAVDQNITTGTSDTTFSPEDYVTRGQAVTFLWRAMGQPEPVSTFNPFTDVSETDYFCKPILWAVEQGITTGTSATTFSPAETCTYAHILTFLWRMLGEPNKTGEGQWYEDAANWANRIGLTSHTQAANDPSLPCPRQDVVTFLFAHNH